MGLLELLAPAEALDSYVDQIEFTDSLEYSNQGKSSSSRSIRLRHTITCYLFCALDRL
jgi:hypothetical protein